jgi:cytochrome c biogenesis protein CcmG/thiol:disulfide interchange protein DsbE
VLKPHARVYSTIFILALVLGAGWIWLTRAPLESVQAGPPPAPREGFAAPDFTLPALDGKTVALHDLRGKVVLLNFWATWCAPCKAEMPAMQRVYADEKGRGLVVLAVTVETNPATVTSFVQRYDLGFAILLDSGAQVSRLYRIQGTPTSFFIDRHGVIRSVVVGGPMSEGLIRSKLEDLLREEAP